MFCSPAITRRSASGGASRPSAPRWPSGRICCTARSSTKRQAKSWSGSGTRLAERADGEEERADLQRSPEAAPEDEVVHPPLQLLGVVAKVADGEHVRRGFERE